MDLIKAPAGFTREEWERFSRDGILIKENALAPQEIRDLIEAIDNQWKYHPDRSGMCAINIVEMHALFSRMIDHPSHIGYLYDVYGESLKLLLSQFFVRPPQQPIRNNWHFDGPRVVPFETFANRLPLRIKVGYWLTDLPQDQMGNLIYIPGSHHTAHIDEYKTHRDHPAQKTLRVKAGTMILMHAGL